MIEILYRGKRVDNGEWIEGFPVESVNNKIYMIVYATEDAINTKNEVDFIYEEVNPETVGQYIGAKGYTGNYEDRHKNEVKLFNGDIVEAWSQGSKATFVISFRNESAPGYFLYPAWKNGKWWLSFLHIF